MFPGNVGIMEDISKFSCKMMLSSVHKPSSCLRFMGLFLSYVSLMSNSFLYTCIYVTSIFIKMKNKIYSSQFIAKYGTKWREQRDAEDE